MSPGRNGAPFTIVQLSDLHCGKQYFLPNLLERAISEINDIGPEIVIPGNHDSRNVGYVHFEDLFGDRNSVLRVGGVTVVAVDSTEPDLDHGQIGRGRYRWIEESFAEPADLRVFVCHHHLLPVPGTGRERNVIYDAGDAIECLQRAGVDLVLSGHKHVPYAWRLEDLFIVNAGTVSSLRLRGHTRPCYNVVEIDGDDVTIYRKYPYHGAEAILRFSRSTPPPRPLRAGPLRRAGAGPGGAAAPRDARPGRRPSLQRPGLRLPAPSARARGAARA